MRGGYKSNLNPSHVVMQTVKSGVCLTPGWKWGEGVGEKQVVWQLQCYIHPLHISLKKKEKPNYRSIWEFVSVPSLNRRKTIQAWRCWGGSGVKPTYRTHYTQVVHTSMTGRSERLQQEKASQGQIHHRRCSSFWASAEPTGSRRQCPEEFQPPYKETSGATFCFTIRRTTIAFLYTYIFFFCRVHPLVSWSLCRDGQRRAERCRVAEVAVVVGDWRARRGCGGRGDEAPGERRAVGSVRGSFSSSAAGQTLPWRRGAGRRRCPGAARRPLRWPWWSWPNCCRCPWPWWWCWGWWWSSLPPWGLCCSGRPPVGMQRGVGGGGGGQFSIKHNNHLLLTFSSWWITAIRWINESLSRPEWSNEDAPLRCWHCVAQGVENTTRPT